MVVPPLWAPTERAPVEELPELSTAPGRREPGAGGERQRPWAKRWLMWQNTCQRLGHWRHFDSVLVVTLTALSVGLRWRGLWVSYWGDEAIAIGIAAQPLGSLPHYLANDGSPPLYYAVLHYWMEVFGRSEVATHALSMIGAAAAVPATWWSGRRLFGAWAARAAAAMVATCAYLDYYATETRMYSWLVLTAILAIACFVLAYRGAGRRYWVVAASFMVVALYLHYYALYLLFAT
ncbi:MAG TPA: glycosyltransferase family 39 protein, partial [Acidimicrobiales bacterium]|nr:glycosyltransferase family 39 protein [Acidimicrobiales bacterium]